MSCTSQAQATGITDNREEKRRFPAYWFESAATLLLEEPGQGHGLLAADLAFLGGYTTFRARSVVQRKPNEEPPPSFWMDFVRNSTLL